MKKYILSALFFIYFIHPIYSSDTEKQAELIAKYQSERLDIVCDIADTFSILGGFSAMLASAAFEDDAMPFSSLEKLLYVQLAGSFLMSEYCRYTDHGSFSKQLKMLTIIKKEEKLLKELRELRKNEKKLLEEVRIVAEQLRATQK